MIQGNDQKVRMVMEEIHKSISKRRMSGDERICLENRVLTVLCQDSTMGPKKCAVGMGEHYGCDLTGDEIVSVFREMRLANPAERKVLLDWAEEIADLFAGAAGGDREAFGKLEKRRREAVIFHNGKPELHRQQERLAVMMIYERYPEFDGYGDIERLHTFGATYARYFFYEMVDAVKNVYGFSSGKGAKKQPQISYGEAIQQIARLEQIVERTNTMLQDLQEEFEEQLEASRLQELTDFFARLNSERYGCILDELLVLRKGISRLQKEHYKIPVEINGLFILVNQFAQFVRDSHIEPMMKLHSIQQVKAADIEYCNYEGTPFTSSEEEKTVKVISSGWIYKDKEIQISRPKVKEEEA